eukprot:356082-Chlamydomonas_euryale.AAC.7
MAFSVHKAEQRFVLVGADWPANKAASVPHVWDQTNGLVQCTHHYTLFDWLQARLQAHAKRSSRDVLLLDLLLGPTTRAQKAP